MCMKERPYLWWTKPSGLDPIIAQIDLDTGKFFYYVTTHQLINTH